MSALPRPSDLGAVALATLRNELIPALPPHLRYTAAMTVRALDYALTHDDAAQGEGAALAQALLARIERGADSDILPELESYLVRERAKVAPSTQKEPTR